MTVKQTMYGWTPEKEKIAEKAKLETKTSRDPENTDRVISMQANIISKQQDEITGLKRDVNRLESMIRSIHRSLKNVNSDLERVREELDNKIDLRN